MPTTLDCTLLGDFFGTPAMRSVFDSRALLQSWLDAEAALAEAEAECGLIPADAAVRIRDVARAESYDLEELRAGIIATQHPLVPLVRALTAAAGESGRFVHYGATTQDIMDTGCILQVRDGLALLIEDLDAIRGSLAALAREHAHTAMAGRTHGQHAVPITFGLKAAVWLAELDRDAERLAACRPRLLVGQLAGAAGTLATLGDAGPAVRRAFCSRLGLAEPSAPWHVARDGLGELVSCSRAPRGNPGADRARGRGPPEHRGRRDRRAARARPRGVVNDAAEAQPARLRARGRGMQTASRTGARHGRLDGRPTRARHGCMGHRVDDRSAGDDPRERRARRPAARCGRLTVDAARMRANLT